MLYIGSTYHNVLPPTSKAGSDRRLIALGTIVDDKPSLTFGRLYCNMLPAKENTVVRMRQKTSASSSGVITTYLSASAT